MSVRLLAVTSKCWCRRGAPHLVLAGIATSGVVLSTVREAADRDYQLTVLANGCLDRDPEVHRVLMGTVFPRQADVVTAPRWEPRRMPDPAGPVRIAAIVVDWRDWPKTDIAVASLTRRAQLRAG